MFFAAVGILRPDRKTSVAEQRCDGLCIQRVNGARGGAMFTILFVILILMLIGALPTWPYSRSWGYYPSGGLGLIVIILLVLILIRAT